MKISLGVSNFLEEISSLSHSVVFLYFFALITEECFLISPCYSLELCIQMGISFLFSFAFRFFFSQLFVRPPSVQFSSVQSLSRVRLFATPWIAACQAALSITNSRSLPKPIPIKSVMTSSHLILCHPLLLLPPILPSIRVFSNESALRMSWPEYWNFSFSISPSNEHPGLTSFRMDWLDLLAVQRTLKSLLQHHSSKASIFWFSAFFPVQLAHPYMTTGKTTALTRQPFVGKVMSLVFNMLSRLVITFFPRSKRLLISWLQSPSAVILEPPKIKSDTVSTVSSSVSHEVMGPDAMILALSQLFDSPLSLSWRGFLVSLLSAIRVVSSAYLRLLIFLPTILIPTWCFFQPSVSHDVLCI